MPPTTPCEGVDDLSGVPEPSSSEEEGEMDPMMSMPVRPFVIPIVVEGMRHRNCTALVDTGCPVAS